MNERSVLLGICGLISLAGCALGSQSIPTMDKAYQVEWLGERPLMDYSHLTLTFEENGRLFGNAGCNHWFGRYQLNDDQLAIHHVGTTRKMCAEALMEQERRFLDLLQTVNRWEITQNGELNLWPESGQPIKLLPEHN